MSYFNRVWMAVENGQSDQGHKLNYGFKSLKQSQKRFTSAGSGGDPADVRPFSAILRSDLAAANCNEEERRKQADESLRQVMYFNCWATN